MSIVLTFGGFPFPLIFVSVNYFDKLFPSSMTRQITPSIFTNSKTMSVNIISVEYKSFFFTNERFTHERFIIFVWDFIQIDIHYA